MKVGHKTFQQKLKSSEGISLLNDYLREISASVDIKDFSINLMHILEDAFAPSSSAFIFNQNGVFTQTSVSINGKVDFLNINFENSNQIEVRAIKHVIEFREKLFLQDIKVTGASKFQIQNHELSSLAIIPVVNKGVVHGVIYMENFQVEEDDLDVVHAFWNVLESHLKLFFENLNFAQKIKVSQDHEKTSFETSIDGIFQIDQDGTIEKYNDSFAEVFKFPHDHHFAEQLNFKDFIFYAQNYYEFLDKIKNFGYIKNYEVMAYKHDKSMMYISINAQKIKNAEYSDLKIEGIVRDITERKLMEQALQNLNRNLENTVEKRTINLTDKKNQIKNILDNAAQGFFTFKKDLFIEDDCSLHAKTLFGKELYGLNVAELFYGQNQRLKQFLNNILKDIFDESREEVLSKFFKLLPNEIEVQNKCIRVEFKLINSELDETNILRKMMVVLTDISQQRLLEHQIETERNTLRMVVRVLTSKDEFIVLYKNIKQTAFELKEMCLIAKELSRDMLMEMYRKIHSIKSELIQYEFVNSIRNFDLFEEQLNQILSQHESLEKEEILDEIKTKDLIEFVSYDIGLLRDVLGESFLEDSQYISVDVNDLLELETMIINNFSVAEIKDILPGVLKLRCKSVRSVLKSFDSYVQQMAEKKNVKIKPLVVRCLEFYLDNERYKGVFTALRHIFSNIVNHGIETPTQRLNLEKPEEGLIECKARMYKGKLNIDIKDDGGGINLEELKKVLIDHHFYDEAGLENFSDQEILNCIFVEGVSTRVQKDSLSGQGYGLAVLKEEIVKMGGFIHVTSEKDKGTAFHMELPLYELVKFPEVSHMDILRPIQEQVVRVLHKELGIDIDLAGFSPVEEKKIVKVSGYNCQINMKGVLKGSFIFSFSPELTNVLARSMMYDEFGSGYEEYYEDTICEMTNIIVGQSLNQFPKVGDLVNIDIPVSSVTEKAETKYVGSEIYFTEIELKEGRLAIYFVY